MDKDDRIKIDQGKDKLQKLLSDLREVSAGYGLESRETKDQETKRRAKADSGILKRIIDLYQIIGEQGDQINKQSETIIKVRMEIKQLKSEIKQLKK